MSLLLAKSPQAGRDIDLQEHSQAVAAAAIALFGHPQAGLTVVGSRWQAAMGLPEDSADVFLRTLILAAWLHDLGKATDGFQAAVRTGKAQRLRHEHLSALLLTDPLFEGWHSQVQGVDTAALVAAVAGHHLKASTEEFAVPAQEGGFRVRILLDAPEVQRILDECESVSGVTAPRANQAITWTHDDVFSRRRAFLMSAHGIRRSLTPDPIRARFVAAVRAALIAADAAGSAALRENLDMAEWIRACFQDWPLSGEWIEEHIIAARVKEIESSGRGTFRWQEFQLAAAELGERGLLLAPCGSGKTLAAWKWAQRVLDRKPASRVVFLYPTRGTATEGFRDYVSWAGGEYAALVHGTSEFDVQGMFDSPDDLRHGEFTPQRQRLFALSFWNRRVFSATVDQFLGFLQNQYGSLCLLPVLCDSIVVIDEVHSFDPLMFTALERFLRAFQIPALCMTATLPKDRMRVLAQVCGLRPFPSDEDTFPDLQHQSEAPRYRVSLESEAVALKAVVDAAKAGQRVLWVLNTVARCQRAYRLAKDRLGDILVLCYHSRFRLQDRRAQHEGVIAAFRRSGPTVAITTQVCEMSLDLDADLLVSELAPMPSLIQRMGRCYRRKASEKGGCGVVILYPPPDFRPYHSSELDQAATFAERLAAHEGAVSQAELASILAVTEVLSPAATDGFAAFLDCGMLASAREESFRDIDEFTVDAVLDMDVEAWRARNRSRDPSAQGLILPAPRKLAEPDARLPKYLRVAPASHYDIPTGLHSEEVTRLV